MENPGATRWSLIERAASGDGGARDTFARTYEPAIRAYLAARWRDAGRDADIADATQEVFLACFSQSGPLARAEPDRPGGFRAYLYGVVRNVARGVERKRKKLPRQPAHEEQLDGVEADEPTLSRVFDRAWALGILREAVRLHRQRAAAADDAGALRRVELLQLRFREGLPIREIAARWGEDAAKVHRAYARARKEFESALQTVVEGHHGGSARAVKEECERLAQYFRES